MTAAIHIVVAMGQGGTTQQYELIRRSEPGEALAIVVGQPNLVIRVPIRQIGNGELKKLFDQADPYAPPGSTYTLSYTL